MGVSEKFERFVNNLQLTPKQLEDAETKHLGVRKVLHSAYYNAQFDGSTGFIIGSYAKGTSVRPPNDVDIMFKVPYETFDKFHSRQGNGQSQLLQEVKLILQRTYSTTSMRADGQVVIVPFATFSIEVAPCVPITNNRFFICDTNDGGSWKTVDPMAEIEALKIRDYLSNGNQVKLVQMLKVWRRNCSVPIKSFMLDLLVRDFLYSYQYHDKGYVYCDWIVRDFFKYLIGMANRSLYMPGTLEEIKLGDLWKSRAESALKHAISAIEDESRYPNLNWEWRKIFGDLFIG